MKKAISFFLALIMLISCSFFISASATENDFNINYYTLNDVMNMSVEQQQGLLNNFIKTYNPYGINDLIEEYKNESSSQIQPRWGSDSSFFEEGQQIATHQIVTLQAFLSFIYDYGFYDLNATTGLLIAFTLAAASALPDLTEKDFAFAWHFYDPNTGSSYNPFTLTAKDLTQSHYTNAKTRLIADVNMDVLGDDFIYVLQELGMAIHYLQDLCEPHHASNQVAGFSTHSQFEAFVDDNINSYFTDVESTPAYYYNFARITTAETMSHSAATTGKSYYEPVKDLILRDNWGNVGLACTRSAAHYSSALIYKLFYECNAFFTN